MPSMTSTSRNAPCPCGSGKKYKLCCLPRESASAPRPTPQEEAQTIRTAAFAKLVAFGGKPIYKTAIESALEAFWSPAFRRRSQRDQDEAFARPEAEAGMITYFMLDAPATFGATIAQQFLAQLGKTLPRADYDYLARLASTRMGLYRIVKVRRDAGLTVCDLWTGAQLEIREKRLTEYVEPNDVIGARAFPATDGMTELDGAVYKFTQVEARKVITSLRTTWRNAQKGDPASSEELFLKRRFPIAINRFYFDRIFFRGPAIAEPASRETIEVDPDTLATVEPQILGRGRLRASRGSVKNYAIPDRQMRRVATFLHSPAAPVAISIDELHGFLTALMCAPTLEMPSTWLPLIWGDGESAFGTQAEADRIIGDIFGMSNTIGRSIEDGTFTPLLPNRRNAGVANIAQVWCHGFLAGMALNERAWEPLVNDGEAQTALIPIFALASPQTLMRDPAPDGKGTADLIDMLKVVVPVIADYWNAALQAKPIQRRKKTRRPPVVAKRQGQTRTAARETQSNRAVREPQTTLANVYRLKISLDGLRPLIWRRIEIAGDTTLPALSRALLACMGWEDSHLHAFRCRDAVYGSPNLDFNDGMRNEARVTLAQIAPNVKDRFTFDYDFGDGWEHAVVVEAIGVAALEIPRCTAGARACPPEDCGGVPGYIELVRILRDPAHDEYAAMRRWAGPDFTPDRFDVATVNERLQRQFSRKRRAH